MDYRLVIHSPFYRSGRSEYVYNVPVLEYDPGIDLTPTPVNGEEIIWRWSGTTVNMGIEYELWAGDQLLTKTKDRHYTIPVTECTRYQIVKARVFVKAGSEHSHAGGWSLFSLPGEWYEGEEGLMNESDITSKYFECLEEKSVSSIAEYQNLLSGFSSANNPGLNRSLYYLTKAMLPGYNSDIDLERYRVVYFFMKYLNRQELDDYKLSETPTQNKTIYKLITQTNQTEQYSLTFQKGMEEMIRRLIGNTTF